MKRIQVLDCTLRDGGYCNQWKFGFVNTKKIVESLTNAGIDIIECGFLTNKVEYKQGITKFTTMAVSYTHLDVYKRQSIYNV